MAATTSATNTNVATSTPGRLCPACARATSRIPWVATLAPASRSSIQPTQPGLRRPGGACGGTFGVVAVGQLLQARPPTTTAPDEPEYGQPGVGEAGHGLHQQALGAERDGGAAGRRAPAAQQEQQRTERQRRAQPRPGVVGPAVDDQPGGQDRRDQVLVPPHPGRMDVGVRMPAVTPGSLAVTRPLHRAPSSRRPADEYPLRWGRPSPLLRRRRRPSGGTGRRSGRHGRGARPACRPRRCGRRRPPRSGRPGRWWTAGGR